MMRTSFRFGTALAIMLVLGSPLARLLEGQQPDVVAVEASPNSDESLIVLAVTLIEIDSDRLAAAGIELRTLMQDGESPLAPADGDDNQALISLLNEREAKLITKLLTTSRAGEIVSKPVLVTQDGYAASASSSQEVRIGGPQGRSGTVSTIHTYGRSIEVTPKKQPGGTVRLEIRVEHAQSPGPLVNGSIPPSAWSRVVDTVIELNPGERVMIAREGRDAFMVLLTLQSAAAVEAHIREAAQRNSNLPATSQIE